MRESFRRAVRGAHRAAHRNRGEKVTYRRGEQAVEIDATRGASEWTSEEDGAVAENWKGQDFLFLGEDLVLPSGRATPAAGDQIWALEGETTVVYELVNAGPDGRCYSYDVSGQLCRVFTQEIDTA